VSAVAEPALPAAAVAAPVPLAAQDPDTRAPRQVSYRWRSPKLNVESPGHRAWPQSGKDSTVVRGNKYVRFVSGVFTPLGHPMSDALLLLATFYRTLYGILGSYVTARFAPNRPMMHALILGAIGVAASLAGVVMAWNRVAEFGPRWYPV